MVPYENIEFYFQKMIFESLLECLEYFRPFGIRGMTLDWKLDSQRLSYSIID